MMATKFNFAKRLEEIKPLLAPPVSNTMLFNDALKVMIVGGPNQRKDFHIEMGEELFYQIVGDMDLVIINPKTERQEAVHIKEGEVFLLPAGIPHSPQRYANTIGLVFERDRLSEEMDCLRWHTDADPHSKVSSDSKAQVLYEEYFHCVDLGIEIKEAIERFHQYLALPIEKRPKLDYSHLPIEGLLAVMERAKSIELVPPFPLDQHLKQHTEDKDISIYDSEFIFKQFRRFTNDDQIITHSLVMDASWKEGFFWQFQGTAILTIDDQSEYPLLEGECLFLPEQFSNAQIKIRTETTNDVTLFVANKFSLPNSP